MATISPLLDACVILTPAVIIGLIQKTLRAPAHPPEVLDERGIYQTGRDETSWYTPDLLDWSFAARCEQTEELSKRMRNNVRLIILLASVGSAVILSDSSQPLLIAGNSFPLSWLTVAIPLALTFLWLEFGYCLYHATMSRRAVEHLTAIQWRERTANLAGEIPPRHILNRPLPHHDMLVTAVCQSADVPNLQRLSPRTGVRVQFNMMVLLLHSALVGIAKALVFVMPATLIAQRVSPAWLQAPIYLAGALIPGALIGLSHIQFYRGAGQRSWLTWASLWLFLAAQIVLWASWRLLTAAPDPTGP